MMIMKIIEICKCSLRVLEQIVADLNSETDFATQSHIKKDNRNAF